MMDNGTSVFNINCSSEVIAYGKIPRVLGNNCMMVGGLVAVLCCYGTIINGAAQIFL
jgi:hypothetical protein